MSQRPLLRVYPAEDVVLAELADEYALLRDGPDVLQARLRAAGYPRAVVHRRELSGEPRQSWYVMREGSALRAGDTSPS